MRFTNYLLPKTSEWIFFCEGIKSKQCPHCRKLYTLKSHGSLYGIDPVKPEVARRGLRFYCSNRYSNKGCGQTFLIHFETIIPYYTVRSSHLRDFFKLLLEGCTTHRAWYSSLVPFSLRSACFGLLKFKLNLPTLRSKLHEWVKNIQPTNQSLEIETINMLKEAFSQQDFIAATQKKFQQSIFPVRNTSS